jgi:hypothetical protein
VRRYTGLDRGQPKNGQCVFASAICHVLVSDSMSNTLLSIAQLRAFRLVADTGTATQAATLMFRA